MGPNGPIVTSEARASTLIISKMKLCKTEPTWFINLNTLDKYGHERTISSFSCDKHLTTFEKQVQDFNLKVKNELSRTMAGSGLSQQEWKEFVLLFAIKFSASRMSRAKFREAISTDIYGKKISQAQLDKAMTTFVCQGMENATFSNHAREVSNFILSGGR
jgi:hypothetical protein